MGFFQLRTVPGCQWPALPDSKFAQIWNAYLELDRTQWLSRAELEARQLEQVRTLLAHCIINVPYFRETLPAAGVRPGGIRSMGDFRKIPLLSRRTYQEKVTPRPATALPEGTVALGTTATSGSSGAPTFALTTNLTQLWWYACYLRDLEWCKIDPTGTLAVIRQFPKVGLEMQGKSAPCWLLSLNGLIQYGPANVMDIRQDPRVQLQWLRGFAADCLLSYSANLEALAALAKQSGPLPGLKTIHSISSTLDPRAQVEIESVFGVPVKNTYSCNEAGYLASPCPDGPGFHVHAENVLLEVLDENDQPCQPGQTGRVFITHLHNVRGPFIRYDLGDEATLGPESCSCGRGLPVLTRIIGRNLPMFRLPGGKLKNTTNLAGPVREIGGHWQHQVIQKAVDHAVVRLAIDPTWTDRHADEMIRAVQEFFEAPIRVELEFHDRLALPNSGKFQSMITEIAG
jgi:phenylacetate-CoA ligase